VQVLGSGGRLIRCGSGYFVAAVFAAAARRFAARSWSELDVGAARSVIDAMAGPHVPQRHMDRAVTAVNLFCGRRRSRLDNSDPGSRDF
jgi:hypothetical protein